MKTHTLIPAGLTATCALAIFFGLTTLGVFAVPADSHAGGHFQHRIIHVPSGKCMYPRADRLKPGTEIVVRGGRCLNNTGDPKAQLVSFTHDKKQKRIRHGVSKQCVLPKTRETSPKTGTKLMLGDCNTAAAQFTMLRDRYFRHISGMCIHLLPGAGRTWVTINDNASLILDNGCLGERLEWKKINLLKLGKAKKTKLLHAFSGKCAHPLNFRTHNNNTIKLITQGCHQNDAKLVFQLLANGAIRHADSGKCLHPAGNRLDPHNGTRLVLKDGCSQSNILFQHLENGVLQHKITGKCLHPQGGKLIPGDGANIEFHEDCHGKRLEWAFWE
ncbi:MAG: hypothetical protein ACR2P7_08915 [bacterium]